MEYIVAVRFTSPRAVSVPFTSRRSVPPGTGLVPLAANSTRSTCSPAGSAPVPRSVISSASKIRRR